MLRHATYVACGLKCHTSAMRHCSWARHATYVACGLKSVTRLTPRRRVSRHATYVACGLKSRGERLRVNADGVMPRMWHVD